MMWFRISNRSQLDKIIITAMDRFVWFVLLVVMSHLVTEFTRVTGYARGTRHELELSTVNETLIEPKSVHNMILYPGQQDYAAYEQQAAAPYYYQNGNQGNRYVYNGLQQLQQTQQQPLQHPNAQLSFPPNAGAQQQPQSSPPQQQGFIFSFRPLIDSIFDIPISTLRAVNNLVARLTGSYQTPPATYSPQKSATLVIETERSNGNANQAYAGSVAGKTARSRQSTLREEMA